MVHVSPDVPTSPLSEPWPPIPRGSPDTGEGNAHQKQAEADPQEANQRMDADIQHERRLAIGALHALIGDEQILQRSRDYGGMKLVLLSGGDQLHRRSNRAPGAPVTRDRKKDGAEKIGSILLDERAGVLKSERPVAYFNDLFRRVRLLVVGQLHGDRRNVHGRPHKPNQNERKRTMGQRCTQSRKTAPPP